MDHKNKQKKIRVAHIITRMIIGGAQENTLSTVLGLDQDDNYEAFLISGPEKGPEGRLSLENIKNMTFINSLRRSINPFLDIYCLIKLIILFRKHRFDIVHTHSSKAGILGRIAAFFARVPVIIHTIHGLPFHKYQNQLINKIFITFEKLCGLFTDKIIVVTDTMKEKALAENIGLESKYVTVFSGMDLDSFLNAKKLRTSAREELGIGEENIAIGKIARLFPLKGHEYILEIAKELVELYPEIVFLWVGDGILKDSYLSKISEMNLKEHFIFTGLVKPQDIKKYLSAMDILVHVSLREGLARVIPQSFAAKVPVISFDIDGAKDLIDDGRNGFLVKPLNIDELKEKVEKLITDKRLREQFANEAAKKVDPFFRQEYMLQEIKKIYGELL